MVGMVVLGVVGGGWGGVQLFHVSRQSIRHQHIGGIADVGQGCESRVEYFGGHFSGTANVCIKSRKESIS